MSTKSENTTPEPEEEVSPFFKACRAGDVEAVKEFLRDLDIDVNKPDENGVTGLIAASETSLDVVDLLLRDDRIKINAVNNEGISGFMVACGSGNVAIVSRYLEEPTLNMNHMNSVNISSH
ncbi:unnamed protein product [Aphanomyces euteiches]